MTLGQIGVPSYFSPLETETAEDSEREAIIKFGINSQDN